MTKRDERGFVLVWTIFMFMGLFAVAGFSIDLSNWYLHIQRNQRAADAASLSGAVYLPAHDSTCHLIDAAAWAAAVDAAEKTLSKNGVDPASAQITPVCGKPTALSVQLTFEVHNAFMALFDRPSNTFTRLAVAEHAPGIAMGSPSNVLGSEPTYGASLGYAAADTWQAPSPTAPNFWLNISGDAVGKQYGDRWTSKYCTGGWISAGCTMAGYNTEWDGTGNTYTVKIPAGTTGSVSLEAFDAVNSDVGDDCLRDGMKAIETANAGNPLYTSGENSPYCTGDQGFGDTYIADTTFVVMTPKESPGGSQVVAGCTHTFPGYSDADLQNGTAWANTTWRDSFRRWVEICRINMASNPTGDYIVRVTTSPDESGMNRFAMRAGVLSGSGVNIGMSKKLNVHSVGRFTTTTSIGSTTHIYYLARIMPYHAGKTLVINAFDIGDTALVDGPTDVRLLPPTNSNWTSLNCTVTTGGTGASITPCGLTGIDPFSNSGWNGQSAVFTVPVPTNYTCADTNPDGCWIRVEYLSHPTSPGPHVTNDTIAWTAEAGGSPVHIIE